MNLDLMLNAAEKTLSITVLLLAVWVWGRATRATRLFSIGLVAMICLNMFKLKLSTWLMISIGSPLWGILGIIPYLFFALALCSEFSWRVVKPKNKKKI